MINVKTEKIFSPEDEPYKIAYGEHAKNFWKWLVSMPKDHNPESDLTGERSANGQENSESSVFYLSIGPNREAKIERTCNIPTGKGILIPVSVVVVSDKEVPEIPNPSIEDLSKKAKKDQDSVTDMYLRIDDDEYQMEDLSRYRIHTGKFEVNFPENALWDVSEGRAMAVADGTYIVSRPLTEGKYTIHWKSSLTCIEREGEPKCIDNTFIQNIKYTIIVK
jgi:hypothetical protein